jgi:hypothetical protein
LANLSSASQKGIRLQYTRLKIRPLRTVGMVLGLNRTVALAPDAALLSPTPEKVSNSACPRWEHPSTV